MKGSEFLKKFPVQFLMYEKEGDKLKITFTHPRTRKNYTVIVKASNPTEVIQDCEVEE